MRSKMVKEFKITNIDELVSRYDDIVEYSELLVVKIYRISHYISYEDIAHTFIMNTINRFNRSKTLLELNGPYIRVGLVNTVRKAIRDYRVRDKYITNSYDLDDPLLESLLASSDDEDTIEIKLREEKYYEALESSLSELSNTDNILLKYGELISSTTISDITGLSYRVVINEINRVKNDLKESINNKVNE